jgi:hypothetical protein
MDMLVEGGYLHVGLLFNFNVDALAAGGWKRVLRRGEHRRSSDPSDPSDISGASGEA